MNKEEAFYKFYIKYRQKIKKPTQSVNMPNRKKVGESGGREI